jgi:hypothetical protein
MPICCYCHRCNGALVQWHVKQNHQRADLKNQTVNQQNIFKLFSTPIVPIAGPSSVLPMSHMHLHYMPAALPMRFDSPNRSSHIEQEYDIIFSASINSESGQPVPLASGSEILEIFSGKYGAQDLEDNPHEEGMFPSPPISNTDEDSPDPFVVEYSCKPHVPTWQKVPHYLLVIYMIVFWLHLQFNLPCVTWNALRAFLASLLTFLNLGIMLPFITL